MSINREELEKALGVLGVEISKAEGSDKKFDKKKLDLTKEYAEEELEGLKKSGEYDEADFKDAKIKKAKMCKSDEEKAEIKKAIEEKETELAELKKAMDEDASEEKETKEDEKNEEEKETKEESKEKGSDTVMKAEEFAEIIKSTVETMLTEKIQSFTSKIEEVELSKAEETTLLKAEISELRTSLESVSSQPLHRSAMNVVALEKEHQEATKNCKVGISISQNKKDLKDILISKSGIEKGEINEFYANALMGFEATGQISKAVEQELMKSENIQLFD